MKDRDAVEHMIGVSLCEGDNCHGANVDKDAIFGTRSARLLRRIAMLPLCSSRAYPACMPGGPLFASSRAHVQQSLSLSDL